MWFRSMERCWHRGVYFGFGWKTLYCSHNPSRPLCCDVVTPEVDCAPNSCLHVSDASMLRHCLVRSSPFSHTRWQVRCKQTPVIFICRQSPCTRCVIHTVWRNQYPAATAYRKLGFRSLRNRYVKMHLLHKTRAWSHLPKDYRNSLQYLSSFCRLKQFPVSIGITPDTLQTASSSLLIMQRESWRQFTELLKYWCPNLYFHFHITCSGRQCHQFGPSRSSCTSGPVWTGACEENVCA